MKWSVTDFKDFGHKKLYSSAELSITLGYCIPVITVMYEYFFYVHMESTVKNLSKEMEFFVRCGVGEALASRCMWWERD